MAPQSFKFDLQTMQNCLEYLSDSLDWLNNIDDHEMFRVSQEIDLSVYDFLAERIQSLVYAIRRIQNRHSAINRLPSEILGAIFEALMPSYPRLTFDERDSDSDSEDDIIGYSPPPWVSQTAHAASSLVCQHWRNVILTTPALWTDIIIPHRALSRDGNSRHGDFISSQLARSGIRSLDVQFNGMFSPASLQLTFVQDLLKQVHRIRRLSIRLQAMNDDIRMWTANARRLEILKISALYGRALGPLEDPPLLSNVQIPRLQTLAVSNYGRWQTATFRTLRHLLLYFHRNTTLVDLASGLMTVFAANAHTLEDIVVSDVLRQRSAEEEVTKILEEVSPVDMPALKRLVVRGMPLFHRTVEPKLVLHECARDYHFDHFSESDRYLPCIGNSNRFPVKKLFIGPSHTVGTDGTAAVRARDNPRTIPLSSFINERDVQELWLGSIFVEDLETFTFEAMGDVKKLVILGDAQPRLSQIVHLNLFPSLSELQLHSQRAESFPAILDFIIERKERGKAIERLRFVREDSSDTADFRMFELRRSHLQSYVADVVYDDDVLEGSKAPRMELPVVCKTKSPIHTYWNPWKLR